MYDDNRFAKHPRFRFFAALNTEMRWRALQTGRVYVKEHPGDAQLSLDELRDMVGREGQTLILQSCVHSIREYQNSYLLFTKVSMHLSISHSLCSAVHNYDSLCRRSSRSPIMLSILLVINYVYDITCVIACFVAITDTGWTASLASIVDHELFIVLFLSLAVCLTRGAG